MEAIFAAAVYPVATAIVPLGIYYGKQYWTQRTLQNRLTEDLTSLYTIDHKVAKAYGRKNEMIELETAIVEGSVVICGPAGCGKTALAESLAYRISKNKIPSLKGAKVLRFKWAQNSRKCGGIQQTLDEFFHGNPSSQIPGLLAQLKQQKDKKSILFIDEFQDFLVNGLNILDDFKEELARGEIRIIGATTSSENIEQWLGRQQGSGVGFRRRFHVIKLQPMTPQGTQEVIKKRAEDLSAKSGISFSRNSYNLIVSLAPNLFPDKTYPDNAVTLLGRIYSHAVNQKKTTEKFIINSKFVHSYAATINKCESAALSKVAEKFTLEEKFRKKLVSEYFIKIKRHKTKSKNETYVESLKLRLKHSTDRWVVLQGNCESHLADIAALAAHHQKPKIYQCDVHFLAKHASFFTNKSTFVALLREAFPKDDRLLFILTGLQKEWFISSNSNDSSYNPIDMSHPIVEDIGKLAQSLNVRNPVEYIHSKTSSLSAILRLYNLFQGKQALYSKVRYLRSFPG